MTGVRLQNCGDFSFFRSFGGGFTNVELSLDNNIIIIFTKTIRLFALNFYDVIVDEVTGYNLIFN